MTHQSTPTRAEASDVANAVLDGTDAVMLSEETAIGSYPAEAVQAMGRIVREAESTATSRTRLPVRGRSATRAVCDAAANLAEEVNASALAALTRSGKTAQTLSSIRPAMPILALLWDDERLARQLILWRGVVPLVTKGKPPGDGVSGRIVRELRARQILVPGSQVVTVGAAPDGPPGRTNFIRLLRI